MWTPLESSPEGLNHYLNKLGVVNSSYQFVDVFGVQEELLDMIPRPVKAMLLVFPLSRAVEMHYRSLLDDQSEATEAFIKEHSVFFARQTIGNACGTVALLHALLNNLDALGELSPDCLLSKIHALMSQTPEDVGTDDSPGGLTAAEQASVNARGLEVLDELRDAHADAADFGEAIQEQDFATNLHFVCFVEIGGRCVEFDGRRPLPVLHGECTDNAHFVSEASKAIETIMSLDPQSFNFAITALARTQPEATA